MYVHQIILNNVVGFHHSHDDLLHLMVNDTHTQRAYIGGIDNDDGDDDGHNSKAVLLSYYSFSSNKYPDEHENRMRYTRTFDKFTQLKSRPSRCYHCNFGRFVRAFFSSVSLISFSAIFFYYWRLQRGNGICAGMVVVRWWRLLLVAPNKANKCHIYVDGVDVCTQIINAKIANRSNANI